MKRKALTFGESNVSVLTAFAGSLAGVFLVTGLAAMLTVFHVADFSDSAEFDYFTLFITQSFMFVGAWFYLAVLRRVNIFRVFRLDFNQISIKKVLLLFAIAVGAILFFAPLAELFMTALIKLGYSIPPEKPVSFSISGLVIAVTAMCILPAFNEEILFRGVLMNGAKRRGSYFAIIYTAFVFMIFHGNPQQTVHQFFLGLILGYLAVTTGNIVFGVIVHFFNNLIAVVFGYIPFNITSDGLIIMYAVWVIVGAVILYLALREFKRLNDKEKFGEEERSGIKDTFVFIQKSLFDKEFRQAKKQAFDEKYGAINEFGGEIDPDALFATGSGEDRKYPTSAKVAVVGGLLMWLLVFVMGMLGLLAESVG